MTNRSGTTLVVGADGQIGGALTALWGRCGKNVVSTTRRSDTVRHGTILLDLGADPRDWTLPDSIDAAIICAAITNGRDCFQDPVATSGVNVKGVVDLSAAITSRGGHVLFLSSNQVFDGLRSYPATGDPVCPVTEYGRQKAEAERRLLEQFPDSVTILRVTKVLGSRNPLLDGWAESFRRGEVVRPFHDMFIAPVPLSTLTSVVSVLMQEKLGGIFQLSADQDVSYAQVAEYGMNVIGGRPTQIQPVSACESLPDQPFPRRTALNTERLCRAVGIQAPSTEWTLIQAFKDPRVLVGNQNCSVS